MIEALRRTFQISDTVNYDTIRGAELTLDIKFEGEVKTVIGRIGFRFVGPEEDRFVPRFRGEYAPEGRALRVRLLLDLAPQELHALQALPEGGFRLRQRSPLQLDALE